VKIGRQILMPAYVRPDQKKSIDALAKQLGVSVQSLMREAVDLVVGKHARKGKQS
jgi:hypothetical protein